MTHVEPKHYRRGDWLTKAVLAGVVIAGISYAVKKPTVSRPDPERVVNEVLAAAPTITQSVDAPAKGEEQGRPAAPRNWSYSEDTD